LTLSPPLTVSHCVLLQLGHGGSESIEPASIVWPQFVHLYVPADTSLPVGTGSAITWSPGSGTRSDYPAWPVSTGAQRLGDLAAAGRRAKRPDKHVLARREVSERNGWVEFEPVRLP
jgi:hypothetical protein